MYFVYALLSLKNKDIYIGFSSNIGNRIKYHNSGKVKSTRNYRPWVLIYQEEHLTRQSANARELKLKHGYQKRELKKLLAGKIDEIWSRSQDG